MYRFFQICRKMHTCIHIIIFCILFAIFSVFVLQPYFVYILLKEISLSPPGHPILFQLVVQILQFYNVFFGLRFNHLYGPETSTIKLLNC